MRKWKTLIDLLIATLAIGELLQTTYASIVM